eukprot:PhF_6_TR20646/c0_g1_i1/m.29741
MSTLTPDDISRIVVEEYNLSGGIDTKAIDGILEFQSMYRAALLSTSEKIAKQRCSANKQGGGSHRSNIITVTEDDVRLADKLLSQRLTRPSQIASVCLH